MPDALYFAQATFHNVPAEIGVGSQIAIMVRMFPAFL